MWDEEASVWVATSEEINELALIDSLIERLKIVISELIDKLPFMLDGFMANRHQLANG